MADKTLSITADEIARGLTDIGVADRTIAVHGSLRTFGHVTGGADAVVDALLHLSPTVLAPAFCFDPNWKPPLDDRPPTNGCDYAFYDDWVRPRIPWVVESASIDESMGVIPHTLAARPDVQRSDHPWHSWLAVGADAEALVASHSWSRPHLPLERLAKMGGYVVLMGVGLRSCTAVHVAEELAGRRPFVRWMVGRDDQVRRIRVAGCSKGFDQLWPHCSDLFAHAQIGSATIVAAPLAPLVDRLASVIREQPLVTVCSDSCLRCRDAALGGPPE